MRSEPARIAILDSALGWPNEYLRRALHDARDFTGLGLSTHGSNHGGRMASIIAGTGTDYAGVCVGAEVVYGRVLGHGLGRDAVVHAIARGIDWAAERTDAILMAFGSRHGSRLISAAIRRATEAGVTVFAAVGTQPDGAAFPARMPAVIGVGPVDWPQARVGAGQPTGVDLLAPATRIPTRGPSRRELSGSSVAAAVAAGLISGPTVMTRDGSGR